MVRWASSRRPGRDLLLGQPVGGLAVRAGRARAPARRPRRPAPGRAQATEKTSARRISASRLSSRCSARSASLRELGGSLLAAAEVNEQVRERSHRRQVLRRRLDRLPVADQRRLRVAGDLGQRAGGDQHVADRGRVAFAPVDLLELAKDDGEVVGRRGSRRHSAISQSSASRFSRPQLERDDQALGRRLQQAGARPGAGLAGSRTGCAPPARPRGPGAGPAARRGSAPAPCRRSRRRCRTAPAPPGGSPGRRPAHPRSARWPRRTSPRCSRRISPMRARTPARSRSSSQTWNSSSRVARARGSSPRGAGEGREARAAPGGSRAPR